MKITKLITGSLLALGLVATPVAAMEFKFGHVGAPGSLFEATANEFARCMDEASDGEHTVRTFGSSQLGKDQELLQQLKLGRVDFSLPSSVMSSVDDTFSVFEMPFLIEDREHLRNVSIGMFDTFQSAAHKKGYHIVAFLENGFRHITNNSRPINVPADLKGVKLRTPRGDWRVKMFRSYGANPTPMSFSEVFVALQTGVIDGVEQPTAQIANGKFQEVQKYFSLTGHVYTPAYLLTSAKQFAKWPADTQKLVTNCGAKTQSFVYEKASALEIELLEEMKAAGIEVNEVDKAAFIEASKPLYDAFAREVPNGDELIRRPRCCRSNEQCRKCPK